MIRFDHVSMVYPRASRPALDDVTTTIERGQFVFVVGSSGSGKSTLLRLVVCEETATAGRVTVAGRELERLPRREVPRLRREIGSVFQDFRLLPGKTTAENVGFALQVVGRTRHLRRHVDETLELVGLAGLGDRYPHELSGGEQQRVAIARAIAVGPTVLLCDEPTGNLDPATSLDIVTLLDEINRRGTTVVMATHDDEIVDAMGKRVIELHDGRLVRDDAVGAYALQRQAALRAAAGPRDAWGDRAAVPTGDAGRDGDGRAVGRTAEDLAGATRVETGEDR
ncbi:cell division ATP-binding protein FtsE [Arsenicicoccus dermatophilus]|uniref:cell division ATP-binding protein FtsE n=1 Tax=Arsenicicoccus dermatophilus TaxID=1076331 RepID=UPI001F4C539F|nr:ATP-binding cassette domain-containing protein [Arsenicicoccus dermatophilus]MCH8613548.1 ATP-binding cassette domain-containing protein [Arsenicicoccus dermatophilus]